MLRKILIGIGLLINFSIFSQISINTNTGEINIVTGNGVVTPGSGDTTGIGPRINLKADLISPVFTTPNIGSATGSITGNAGTVTGFTPANGSLILVGADALTISTTGTSSVTIPISGTLATTQNINDSILHRLSVAGLGLALADSNVTYYTVWYVDSLKTAYTQSFSDLWTALGTISGQDFTAPIVDSVSLGGLTDSTFICFFDTTDLHQDSIPLVGSFTITEEGNTYGLDNIDIHNDSLIVTMDSIAHYDSTYLFTYTRSLFPELQDSSHNKVATFSNHAVTNYIEAPSTPDQYAAIYELANCEGFYAYDEGYTDDGGGLISQWNDLSSHARNVTATTTHRPTWSSGGMIFTGANTMANTYSLSQPICIYMVAQVNDWTNFDEIIGLGSPSVYQAGWEENPGGYGITLNGGSALTQYGTVLNDDYIFRFFFNGASSKQQWNALTATSGQGGAGTMTVLDIGGNTCADMTIKCIVICSSTDNESTILSTLNSIFSVY